MTLTPAQLEKIAERTRAEREAQGLPPVVEDPAALAKVARLVSAVLPAGGTRPAPVVGGSGTLFEGMA